MLFFQGRASLLFQFLCLIFFVWFFIEVFRLLKLKTLQGSPWSKYSTLHLIMGIFNKRLHSKDFKGRPHWSLLEVMGPHASSLQISKFTHHGFQLTSRCIKTWTKFIHNTRRFTGKSHFKKLLSRLNHLKWIWSPWNGLERTSEWEQTTNSSFFGWTKWRQS